MEYLEIQIPDICCEIKNELEATPFYRVNDGYRYAEYLLTGERNTKVSDFLSSDENTFWPEFHDNAHKEIVKELVRTTLKNLSELIISDEDFLNWTTTKKDSGSVAMYHSIMESFFNDLIQLSFQYLVPAFTREEKQDKVNLRCGDITFYCYDKKNTWEERKQSQNVSNNTMVLNHRNPFADISIHNQQFIYGSVDGRFETLHFTTNHTLTTVAKDMEKSYLALQPGFKIRKYPDVIKKQQAEVLFDDTLTTPIDEDTNVYIYID